MSRNAHSKSRLLTYWREMF